MNYTLTPVDARHLAATDLKSEVLDYIARATPRGTAVFFTYKVHKRHGRQDGELLWLPDEGRAGIAWGADAQWTDASSPEDAVERFLGLNGKEMCN